MCQHFEQKSIEGHRSRLLIISLRAIARASGPGSVPSLHAQVDVQNERSGRWRTVAYVQNRLLRAGRRQPPPGASRTPWCTLHSYLSLLKQPGSRRSSKTICIVYCTSIFASRRAGRTSGFAWWRLDSVACPSERFSGRLLAKEAERLTREPPTAHLSAFRRAGLLCQHARLVAAISLHGHGLQDCSRGNPAVAMMDVLGVVLTGSSCSGLAAIERQLRRALTGFHLVRSGVAAASAPTSPGFISQWVRAAKVAREWMSQQEVCVRPYERTVRTRQSTAIILKPPLYFLKYLL